MGREVKIGWVTMTTGVFAGLSEPDDFLLNQAKETIGDGLVCADGLKHPIAWIVKDSQSDTNRAAEVAGELITQDKPDIVFGGMTPVVNIPVGQQCEANGVPCVTYGCPMEPWFVGMGGNPADPTVGFNWAFNVFFSVGDLNQVYLGLLDLLPTNKKVACMWPNDPDGEATADPELGMHLCWKGAATRSSSLACLPKVPRTTQASSTSSKPRAANAWWERGRRRTSPTSGSSACSKASAPSRPLSPGPSSPGPTWMPWATSATASALEVWWEKTWPYHLFTHRSYLPGDSRCLGGRRDRLPTRPALGLTGGGGFEVVIDVVKRTADHRRPGLLRRSDQGHQISETILGPVKFDGPLANCALSPLVGGQWIGRRAAGNG